MTQNPAAHHPPTISWEYVPLLDIEVTTGVARDQARLLCEEDEGGWMSSVCCNDTYLFYLTPYADLLSAWLQDKSAVERPVVPIYRSGGRLYFSLSGAEHDYPELLHERARRFSRSPFTSLKATNLSATAALHQFRKAPTKKG